MQNITHTMHIKAGNNIVCTTESHYMNAKQKAVSAFITDFSELGRNIQKNLLYHSKPKIVL